MAPAYFKKDIDKMKKVQRRALKLATDLKSKEYEERLISMGLTRLATRQIRGDLIQIFKLVNNIDNYNIKYEIINFENNEGPAANTRSHEKRIYIELIKNSRARYYYFINRAGRIWNKLPSSVAEANSLNSSIKGKNRRISREIPERLL